MFIQKNLNRQTFFDKKTKKKNDGIFLISIIKKIFIDNFTNASIRKKPNKGILKLKLSSKLSISSKSRS